MKTTKPKVDTWFCPVCELYYSTTTRARTDGKCPIHQKRNLKDHRKGQRGQRGQYRLPMGEANG